MTGNAQRCREEFKKIPAEMQQLYDTVLEAAYTRGKQAHQPFQPEPKRGQYFDGE